MYMIPKAYVMQYYIGDKKLILLPKMAFVTELRFTMRNNRNGSNMNATNMELKVWKKITDRLITTGFLIFNNWIFSKCLSLMAVP